MLGRSGYSRAIAANVGEIERRLRSLERQLERAGSRGSAKAAQAYDHVGDTVASVLSGLVDQFRSSPFRGEAAKFGNEAAKLGNDALRRLSKEVEHRPLVTLGVAVGVGLLVGLVALRR
jgi:ElaB/YqjD/DUF883 family membrane-anchored ribosome-binding protein